MNFDFTPFNPYVWSIFLLSSGLTVLIIKIYHRRYPGYPYTSGSTSLDPDSSLRNENTITDHEGHDENETT